MRNCAYPAPFLLLATLALQFGCQGKGGSAAAPAAPRVTSLTATPASVAFGEPSTLAWTLSGAPSTLLLADDLSGAAPRDVSGLADLLVNPVRRQTFTLMAGTDPASAAADPNPVRVTVAAKGLDLLAGQSGGRGNVDGSVAWARFNSPQGVAVDGAGNILVADTWNGTIRRISPAGMVTTFAGKAGSQDSVDGQGAQARFMDPCALLLDPAGNLLVADRAANTLRRITPDGTVTTLAGQPADPENRDGVGAAARFSGPSGLALDRAGILYIADSQGNCIRRMTPDGMVTTLAGDPAGVTGFLDGSGTEARFSRPQGLAMDPSGALLVADSGNGLVRRVTAAGQVTTLAGIPGQRLAEDGPAGVASFDTPMALAVDAGGAVWVGESACLRRIDPDGMVTTVAGRAGEQGDQDGPSGRSRLSWPAGIAWDAAGGLIMADQFNNAIRRLDRAGAVATLAGGTISFDYAEGRGAAALLGEISASAVDAAGNLYVADSSHRVVRKITPDGVSSLFAGVPDLGGYVDGPAGKATLGNITAMAAGPGGNLYVADMEGAAIRVVSPQGDLRTLAGNPDGGYQRGLVDGVGSNARFIYPRGLALDPDGNLYVADGSAVRKVTPAGAVTTLAGDAAGGHVDGTGLEARFAGLSGLARDAQGNLFMNDGNCIRRMTPDGVVSTLAGSYDQGGYLEGTGEAARFTWPRDLALDAGGNLYVADVLNNVIRKVSPGGVVSTVVGRQDVMGLGFGPLPGSLANPKCVGFTPAGDLLVIQDHCVAQVTSPD